MNSVLKKKFPAKWKVKEARFAGNREVIYLDKSLSMDEYLEFVNFCAQHFPRKKMSKNEWLAIHRGVPFSLK